MNSITQPKCMVRPVWRHFTLFFFLLSFTQHTLQAQTRTGDLILRTQSDVNALLGQAPFKILAGNLTIRTTFGTLDPILNLSALQGLGAVTGNLSIQGNTELLNLSGLSGLDQVEGTLRIENNSKLISLVGLEKLATVKGSVSISLNPALQSLTGLPALQSVGETLFIFQNPKLASLSELTQLKTVGADLIIDANPLLTNIGALAALTGVGGKLEVINNPLLASCCVLQPIIAATVGTKTIANNAAGCTSAADIAATCNPFLLSSLSPTRNARTAAPSTSVTVTASANFTDNAATKASLRVFSAQAGGRKAGTASVSGKELGFDPATDFKAGETVLATLTPASGLAKAQVYQFTTATVPSPGTFSPGSEVAVGSGLTSVVAADVDGDGDLDILAANFNSNSVSVRLNDGSGAFSGNTDVAVGGNPSSVTAADVDGDGDLDFITANTNSRNVSVRLNDGNGNFSGNTDVTVGSGPFSVTAADVDGDGDLDILTANQLSNSVSVRFNSNNQPPVAINDAYTTDEDTRLNVAAPGVLSNDTDVDNDALTAILISGPMHATFFTLNADGSFSYTPGANYNGPDSFTYKANDGKADSGPATVSITINAVNDKPVLAGVQPTYTVNELTQLTFTATATATDLPANTLAFSLENAPAGAAINAQSGAFSWTPTEAQGPGSFTFTVKVTDNGTPSLSDEKTITVTVGKRTTALAYGGALSGQYSDIVNLTATLTDAANGTAISGRTVTFGLGTQNATAATLATGVASTPLTLNQPEAQTTVASAFAGDNLYEGSTDSDPFAITREDAAVAYSGLEYFATANSNSTVANVEYIATLTDTTDGSRGVVTNAQARFSGGTLPRTVPVTPLFPGNLTVGTARTGLHTETLNQQEYDRGGKTYELTVAAQGGFYQGQTTTLVTVAVPGTDFVNGGGNLVMARSAGTHAATAGSRMNFGFTMKWNRSGRNIKGQANIIFRRLEGNVWRTYQIKSNAINTLGTFNVTGGRRADFNTKANLTDITNPAAPVSLGGNMDLSVQAFESTDRTLRDQISVTLRNGGVLVFSSSWNGSASVMQNLSGGAVRVRSGAAITPIASRMSAEPTAQAASGQTGATAYPNPFRNRFTLRFGQEVTERTVVSVFDLNGSLVIRQTVEAGNLANGLEVDMAGHRPGLYVVRTVSGGETTIIKVVKQ